MFGLSVHSTSLCGKAWPAITENKTERGNIRADIWQSALLIAVDSFKICALSERQIKWVSHWYHYDTLSASRTIQGATEQEYRL